MYASTSARWFSPIVRIVTFRLKSACKPAFLMAWSSRPLTRAVKKTGATCGLTLKVIWTSSGVNRLSKKRSPSLSQKSEGEARSGSISAGKVVRSAGQPVQP
jgi:hypothetical protein